jgi:hypothetical protein
MSRSKNQIDEITEHNKEIVENIEKLLNYLITEKDSLAYSRTKHYAKRRFEAINSDVENIKTLLHKIK